MRGTVEARDQRLEAAAALGERQRAHILLALGEKIVDAQMRRIVGEELWSDALPVEALLQHVEALHAALAQDQELAVERALEVERLDEVREGAGHVLAGARIDAAGEPPVRAPAAGRLEADAVPFPLGHEVGGIELGEVLLLERVREHRRPERRRVARFRPRRPALDPGEQLTVRRLEPMPDMLDLVRRDVAEARDRGLRQPRRDADAQLAGDELEERPARRLVEDVEP